MVQFIIKDLLGTPAILIGFFSLSGLLLQGKPVVDIISGSIRTVMGFLILIAGANVVSDTLVFFSELFERSFSGNGVVPNTDAMSALVQSEFGSTTAMIMIFGMLLNILLARFTPLKYIFLTGHHSLYMASMLAMVLSTSGMGVFWSTAIGALLLGVMMVVSPSMLQPFTKKITGSDSIAVGHFGSSGYLLAALTGKIVGKNSPSVEKLKIPRTLNFLNDSSVAISLTMMILFLTLVLIVGKEFTEEKISGGQNFIIFAIIQSVTFAAGVYIVFAGVRMVVGEIVPAFKGIADRLVKDSKPALDCSIVFPFSPNAAIVGFLCSLMGGLVSIFLFPVVNLSTVIPGLVPHFFCGATAGVYGNATGGIRGAVLGSFFQGLLISFSPAIFLMVAGNFGFTSTTFGDADFSIVGVILSYVINIFD